MKEKDRSKERKYLTDFHPDVVQLTERYQYEAQRFDAGNGNKAFSFFLKNEEWKDCLYDREGVTFIVLDSLSNNEKKIVAYYTISMGVIPYTDRWLIPEEEREDLINQYDEKECGISAVEIKMFAVAKEYQDIFFVFEGKEQPVSAWILHEVLNRIQRISVKEISTKAVFLNAVPEAEKFYLNNGFDYVQPGMHAFYTNDSEYKTMYLPLTELRIHYDK